MDDVTEWLRQAGGGDAAASEKLYAAVYTDLRRIAQRMLRSVPGPAGATSLVHEAYLRLARPGALNLADRRHFFAVAARAMRQLVLDRARRRNTSKRGGEVDIVPIDDAEEAAASAGSADALAIEQALQQLGALDPGLVELVEMRFYAGLSMEEISELSDRSARTLKREWRRARAFLHAQLGDGRLPADDDA